MQHLADAIDACRTRLARHRKAGGRIGEQNTKAMLIEPVLQALGWDLYDPDEVNREYRRRPSDNPVDYALLLMRTPRLFVEAKGLGENLNDPRWSNQIISYATVAGVEWVALTDGAEWRIYNAHAPVPIEDKLFRAVRLDDNDPAQAQDTLALLSTENMRENRIRELWRSFFIDRQVNNVLLNLFDGTEPPPELVRLIATRTERVAPEDVRGSLLRVRATFDWPHPEIEPPRPPSAAAHPTGNAPPATQQVPAPTTTGHHSPRPQRVPRVTPEERRLSLTDLIRAGRLRPGTIVATYENNQWSAELDGHGTITFRGRPYRSLSAAGEAVKLASRGPDIPATVLATDGWLFWRATDAKLGDQATLKELRRREAGAT